MIKAVTDSAAAADGGSLALFVEHADGTVETFVVNRSIASRGTAAFDTVRSNLRALTLAECLDAAAALQALLHDTPEVHPVGEFIGALRAMARAG